MTLGINFIGRLVHKKITTETRSLLYRPQKEIDVLLTQDFLIIEHKKVLTKRVFSTHPSTGYEADYMRRLALDCFSGRKGVLKVLFL